MNRFHSTLLTTLSLCLVLTTFPSLALANAAVGEVLLSIGKNIAVASDGQIRPLKRKSELFEGDRIETAPRGRIQIRFSDGSLLSLKAATQFQVEQYQFDPQAPDEGEAVYQLLKGGMRTVTGLIGRNDKQDYRLETPVATIGIRGTHYSLQLCDAACAAQTHQPEGLFGGVTQGGIQVGNDSGSYAIGVNDYFYVPDRLTPLTPLLEPPTLLNEEKIEGEEQAAASSPERSATASEQEVTEGATNERIDATTSLAASQNELGSFASAAEIQSEQLNTHTEPHLTGSIPSLDPETTPPPPDADTDATNGEPNTGTNTVAAPDNAAVGIAFTVSDATFGAAPMSGGFVTGGSNSALLDSNNTLLSFGVVDPQATDGGDGCNPCLFDAASATLSDVGGAAGAGIGINWGRWTLGWNVSENGNSLPHTDQFHYIYSPNRSSESLVKGLSGVYQFDFIGGTLPSDDQDNLGPLPGGTILVDFDNEMVLGITLSVQVGDRTIVANQLHTLTPLDQLLFADGPGVPLIGTCSGASCGSGEVRGDFNLSFVGDGAERIMGSWGLMEETPSQVSSFALVGVSAYEQDITPLAPSSFRFANPGSALNLASIHSEGPGQHKGRTLQINAEVNTAIVVDTINDNADTPIYTHFETQDGNGNITCSNCEISSGRASLQDTGALLETGQQVNWGRWDGQWAATSTDPTALRPFGALHYIFSENTTPDNVVRSLQGSVTYFRSAGTQPTDHLGNVGSYGSANSINVDFSSQMVVSAVMDLSVGGRTILMTEQNPVPIEALLSNQPIPLVGSCSGGDCNTNTNMLGAMGVDFVGSNAERLISSYGLSDDSASPSIAVTGTGVYQSEMTTGP